MGGGGSYVQQSPGERMQADLAEEQWHVYQDKFQPLDAQRIARAKDKDRGRTLGIGMAAGGAGRAYDNAETAVVRGMTSRGVNPNSGRFVTGLSDVTRARGFGVGKAAVGSDTASDMRYAGNMMNTIAHGRGKQGIGLEGIRSTAIREHSNAVADAEAKAAEYSAMVGGIGKLAGYGIGSVMAPGPNGAASGWEAFGQARDAGAGFGESVRIGLGQMQANRY